jgi:hypothetical protein
MIRYATPGGNGFERSKAFDDRVLTDREAGRTMTINRIQN